MTLGERILQHRTARGWSQEDLAAALEVSRQSVSKWETDASTPDLDKIVRLSEIFEVSLDELVTGRKPPAPEPEPGPAAPEPAPVPPAPGRSIAQIVIGAVLLGLSILLTLLLLGNGGFILVVIVPLLLCSVICFKVRCRAGLWCGWVLYFGTNLYLHIATGISWKIIFLTPQYQPEWNYMRLAIGWGIFLWSVILLVLTAVSFRELRVPRTRENIVKYIVLVLAVFVFCPLAMRFAPSITVFYGLNLTDYLLNAAQLLLVAWAVVLGAAMLRHAIKQRGA